MTNTSAFADLVKELIATERNYVKKMRILKTDYADPLRSYSKDKHTAIIGPYEAKTLFGNIDQLLPVNEAFLADLEKMDPTGNGKPGVGDVALKHFKKLKGFEKYGQYFAKHEEVQRLMEQEQKKNSRFAEYIEVCSPVYVPRTLPCLAESILILYTIFTLNGCMPAARKV